jgi:organic hydroperoxide reductase OsmC/OhrA
VPEDLTALEEHDREVAELTKHEAIVVWDRTKADLRAHRVEFGGEVLAGSCMPGRGGDPSKADPEQLFVASLSTCHMLWFLDFARRERLRVLSYEDRPVGTMDGVRFVEVVLHPSAGFASDVANEKLALLHERAHDACFIARSVSCAVRVEL